MKNKLLASAISILAILVIWNFIPKKINETLNGLYYEIGNEDFSENIQMHIEGTLSPRFFGNKKFEGTVKFEGNIIPSVPEDRTELELLLFNNNIGTIASFFRIGSNGTVKPSIHQYGYVYINNNFSQFAIKVFNNNKSSWSEGDGSMIVAPAGNRDEAIELSKKLIKEW